MSNIISIYLLTIIFFLKKKTTSILTAPNGLKWVTYTSSNEITVEGDSFIDVILYDFKYIYSDGTENILSDQTSSRQIYHVQVKMVLLLSYLYKTGNISNYQISFFCASVPSIMQTPYILLSDTTKIILT